MTKSSIERVCGAQSGEMQRHGEPDTERKGGCGEGQDGASGEGPPKHRIGEYSGERTKAVGEGIACDEGDRENEEEGQRRRRRGGKRHQHPRLDTVQGRRRSEGAPRARRERADVCRCPGCAAKQGYWPTATSAQPLSISAFFSAASFDVKGFSLRRIRKLVSHAFRQRNAGHGGAHEAFGEDPLAHVGHNEVEPKLAAFGFGPFFTRLMA
jgi:hypothetical protein